MFGDLGVKGRAGGRQRQRAMAAREQWHPQRVFQRFDLPRQYRLGKEQLLGGECE